MEIALLAHNGLKIKEKNVTFAIDAHEKGSYAAVFALQKSADELLIDPETVAISGPGEYEIGGVKISGTSSGTTVIYSIRIGSLSLLLGTALSLEKMQQKLKEHDVVVVANKEGQDISFVTALASNVVILYGEKAAEAGKALSGDAVKQMTKYAITRDKLPVELETVVLQS